MNANINGRQGLDNKHHRVDFRALHAVALKDMDPSLLVHAIRYEAVRSGIVTTQLECALAVASYAHLTQRRTARGDLSVDPYITHPSRNVLRLMRYGCTDIDVLVATALHDTVEDQPVRVVEVLGANATGDDKADALRALREHFGTAVSTLVAAVTNPPRNADTTAEQRNLDYVAHVSAAISDPKVFLVKVSDFVDNAGSLRHLADEKKRIKLARKYAPVVEVFQRALAVHGDDLELSVDGLTQLADHLGAIDRGTNL